MIHVMEGFVCFHLMADVDFQNGSTVPLDFKILRILLPDVC